MEWLFVLLILLWVLFIVGNSAIGFKDGKNEHGLSGDHEWFYQEPGYDATPPDPHHH